MDAFTAGICHQAGSRPNPSRLRRNGREGAERRGGVCLKLLDARVFNAVTVNTDFACVEWPGGVDLCLDTMHQAMTGSAGGRFLQTACRLKE
jgi:hypothetical protein